MGPEFRLCASTAKPVKARIELITTVRTTAIGYQKPYDMEIRDFKYAARAAFRKGARQGRSKGVPDPRSPRT